MGPSPHHRNQCVHRCRRCRQNGFLPPPAPGSSAFSCNERMKSPFRMNHRNVMTDIARTKGSITATDLLGNGGAFENVPPRALARRNPCRARSTGPLRYASGTQPLRLDEKALVIHHGRLASLCRIQACRTFRPPLLRRYFSTRHCRLLFFANLRERALGPIVYQLH